MAGRPSADARTMARGRTDPGAVPVEFPLQLRPRRDGSRRAPDCSGQPVTTRPLRVVAFPARDTPRRRAVVRLPGRAPAEDPADRTRDVDVAQVVLDGVRVGGV